MPDPEEEKLVGDLDREISRKEGLIALVICLCLGAWLIAATAMGLALAG